jgi:hypothetical protein
MDVLIFGAKARNLDFLLERKVFVEILKYIIYFLIILYQSMSWCSDHVYKVFIDM